MIDCHEACEHAPQLHVSKHAPPFDRSVGRLKPLLHYVERGKSCPGERLERRFDAYAHADKDHRHPVGALRTVGPSLMAFDVKETARAFFLVEVKNQGLVVPVKSGAIVAAR